MKYKRLSLDFLRQESWFKRVPIEGLLKGPGDTENHSQFAVLHYLIETAFSEDNVPDVCAWIKEIAWELIDVLGSWCVTSVLCWFNSNNLFQFILGECGF